MREQPDIECVVLKEFDRGDATVLRVVKWVIDGVDKSIMIERRSFHKKDDKIVMGKASGLRMKELEIIRDRWDELVELMKPTPAISSEGIVDVAPDNAVQPPF